MNKTYILQIKVTESQSKYIDNEMLLFESDKLDVINKNLQKFEIENDKTILKEIIISDLDILESILNNLELKLIETDLKINKLVMIRKDAVQNESEDTEFNEILKSLATYSSMFGHTVYEFAKQNDYFFINL